MTLRLCYIRIRRKLRSLLICSAISISLGTLLYCKHFHGHFSLTFESNRDLQEPPSELTPDSKVTKFPNLQKARHIDIQQPPKSIARTPASKKIQNDNGWGHQNHSAQINRRCEDLLRPNMTSEPQRWQPVADREVYVFSAFYDPRPDAGGPAIRVLAMGWQAEYRTIGDLYCQLWYDQQEQPVVTLAEYNRIYRSTRYPEMYVSHFILCHGQFSSTKTLPFAMSVTAEPCSKPENQLLILNKNTTVKKQGHALCLPFLYYFKPPLITSLIELVEFHRLLGVERITMYYNPIDLKFKEVRGFLDYYHKNISLIEVVPWILPRGLLIDYHAQRAAINECFYRSMNNFNFVTISDIDEIIMPRAAKSLPELMNIIDKPNRGAFSFQHFHFKEKNKGDQIKMNPHLISQTAVHRTDKSYPAGKIRCKTIYKSSKAIKLDIHYAYELVSSAESYLVDPREGMLHHYRKTPMSTMRDESKFNYIRDIYAQNWKKNLLDRVTKVLGVIK